MANKAEFRTPATLAMHEAQKQATVNVELYVRTEAVKLPAKQAEKLDALRAMIDQEAVRLFTQAMLAGATELGEVPAQAAQAVTDEGKTPPPVEQPKPAKKAAAEAPAGKPGDMADPFA